MLKVAGKPAKACTIRDVASHAGVSVGTVSKIINGSRNVSPALYQRTMEAIKAKRYTPRTVTQFGNYNVPKSKSGLRTSNIGLLFYPTPLRWKSSQIYLEYLSGVESGCSARGYHPLVECIPASRCEEPPRFIAEGKVDGVLVKGQAISAEYARELGRVCPVVLLNDYNPSLQVPQVVCDNHGAASCLVDHLLGLGHRRIAFVNIQPGHGQFINRAYGYCSAMKIHRLFDPSLLIELDLFGADFDYDRMDMPSMEPAVDAVLQLNPRPTAVIFANDWAASESYKAFRARGIRVGPDISVVGFDNLLPLCELMDPPLASVMIPFREIAELAATVLIDQIEGTPQPAAKTPHLQMIPGKVIRRDSICPVRQSPVRREQ